MASENLQQLRDIQQNINNLKQRQVELQARGEELDQQALDRLDRLEKKEASILSLQERIVNARYRGNRVAGELTEKFSDQLSELSSISTVYSKLTNKQKELIDNSREELRSIVSQQNASQEQISLVSQIAGRAIELQSIQQKIAETDSTKVELQEALRDKHEGVVTNVEREIALALAQNQITDEQAASLTSLLQTQQEGLKIAEEYATVSAETKERIESQIDAYNKMKKTVSGTLDTIRMTLQTPQAMIMAASVAAGKFANAMGDVNKQTGMFMASTAGLSFVFDDAAGTLSQMAKLSGDVNKATFMAQLNTNVLATSMGIGGEEAATLVNAFGNLQGLSQETGEQMVSMVGNTARMSGVLPSQVMKDMAGASEEMALYSKGTGENFAMAAIQASKLGVSIATTAKMADNLLDFETSIEKELEASAMLGRDLNLSKARELAYAEDIEGATAEVLKQVGGIDEFNKMDVYQKKAVADALGISVAELKQMSANQETLNNISKKYGENAAIAYDYIRAMGQEFGGSIASGATFLVGELIRAKVTMAAMNSKGIGGFFKSLIGKGEIPNAPTTPSAPTAPTTAPQTGPMSAAGGMSKINTTALIKGSFAILILSAALFVAAKAFQEFGSVEWPAVTMGLTALAGLSVLALILGKGSKEMIRGAAAVAILGVALIPMAYALNLMSQVNSDGLISAGIAMLALVGSVFLLGALLTNPAIQVGFGLGVLAFIALGAAAGILGAGLMLLGNGFSTIASALPLMAEQLSVISQIDFLPIFGLAGALTSLAIALAMVGTMGLLALPVLGALGAVGGLAAEIFGVNEGDDNGVIKEIKGLREDLMSGKIAVYMDGQLVTAKVANVASKNPVT